ncbi:MAG: leucine-rich repeat domain-containing protein [Oscillospiraceae bacterium]|nr:leucine-rich repeat domain-containing protein [Oscillospiraceae bacterium]
MKKKLCGAALAFAILIGLFNIPAWAAGVAASGECGATGNDITWTLDREGLFSVDGVGAMRDYASADALPWRAYRDQITAVVIQEGVTSVGNNAFRTCPNLESVTLPESLTSIGDVAFYECSALEKIELPAALKSIGANAFGYCGLKDISIPAGVTEIGESAFFKCAALTAINVDEENENYSSDAGVLFDKLAVSPNFSTLIWYPAAKTGAEYLIPPGAVKVGDYAFHSATLLTKVSAPVGLKEIGRWAFAYDTALLELELPAELTTVGDYAFSGCVSLSDDDGNAFKDGDKEAKVIFAGSRQQWSALEMGDGNNRLTNSNIIFGDMRQDNIIASGECGALGSNASWSLSDKGELLISGTGAALNYSGEASVPWANYRRADDNEAKVAITTVTLEGSVTRNDAGEITSQRGITNVGDYAFYDCESLTKVTLPPTLTAVGAYSFAHCPALADINLSDTSAESIGNYAFNGSSALLGIDFPDTLKTIGDCAFLRSGLTSVTVPTSVEEIGKWAFRECKSITDFTMEPLQDGDAPHYTSIGDYAIADCDELQNLSFTENLTVLGEYALSRCVKLEGVELPSSVSGVGACAFRGCSALGSIKVDAANQTYYSPDGILLLNTDQTYVYCYPAGRAGACSIPQSVTGVAAFAFDGAEGLKDVYYEGTLEQWNASVAPNIGAYNAPLFSAELHCAEAPAQTEETAITEFGFGEEGDSRTANVSVHCAEDAGGVEIWCATYADDGRFLDLQMSDTLSPGADDDLSFTLPEGAAYLRLFVTDGARTPLCEAETYDIPADE